MPVLFVKKTFKEKFEKKLLKKAAGQILLNLMLILLLVLSNSASVLASDSGVLTEVRTLLKNQYVDQVSEDVLNAPTVDEMLERLGDPHTRYFTEEEFQEFVGSINLSFSGIGIHIEMIPEGVQILGVIPGSPAEEVGLKSGDVIIRAAGESLAGLSSEEAVSILRGPDGSSVQLRVKRETETRDLKVTRREISEPTVTGEVLDGHIGYLDLNSFGSDTPKEFEVAAKELKAENVDSWIVDLRDNGGGYLSSAMELAGYFIGSDVAVKVKDRNGVLHPIEAEDPGWRIKERIVFLVNENSASASEILSAAVKDHEKATIVGTTSYGKGTVQSMFPIRSGGVLKMTVDHFYSPLGHEIDQVGVSPNVVIEHSDPLKAAELMLTDSNEALKMARTDDYWEAWGELSGVAANTPQETQSSMNFIHYFSNYRQVAKLTDIPLDKKFTVNFSGDIDWQTVNSSSIELINSSTGERTPTTLEHIGTSGLQVIPQAELIPDTTYWLVIHPDILGVSGQTLQEGGLAIAKTVQRGADISGTSRIQSIQVNKRVTEMNKLSPTDPDYGTAIKDLP
ncbi:S41 family peptidase [Desulfosporosinus meridiei]|uniref:C-terminal processing peptidase n=1 Tax=Desulfosporosinus meridiei (strain ATCC BAA-275 / DSM 13257 / KCTC 12902 / NCIMB 13706 / S10) TaxID=768704 RepID=J7IW94_DESMD|nr:S41 family peptidase [Desulfosporosinus meridiei]AFQ46112.1 C-terminal processing peptidase [Desulfosporosinus meridiei DSM 13257]